MAEANHWMLLVWSVVGSFLFGVIAGAIATNRQRRKDAIAAGVAEWRVDRDGQTSFVWLGKKSEVTK